MTSKKTPTKKPAAKAAVSRTDYKVGTRVKVKRRDDTESSGYTAQVPHIKKETCVETKATGSFIYVNIGDKKNPLIKGFRPARVRGY
jgi:hypothetical protein